MFRTLFFLLFIPFFSLIAKQKVCLNMIVKDEAKVIERCLNSCMPIVDYWVIVDTGSKDGTQKLIKNYMKKNWKNVPGELHQRKWKNFQDSRNEAFELAKGKGDYILFMDADDTLEFDGEAKLPELTSDLCHMWRGIKGFTYLKPQLVKGTMPWKWVGVTHEYLHTDQPYSTEVLPNVKYLSGDGGARSNGTKKFWENVKLLEGGLKKEPQNSRYMFYLAESYRDAGEKAKALECYQKRVNMGGWPEEVFWSKLQIALIIKDLGLPFNIVMESFKDAHNYRPHRVEPIYYMAEFCNNEKNYVESYKWIKARDAIQKPAEKDSLFNIDWMEDYGVLFQLSICSYYVGQYKEALDACDKLLTNKNLPEGWKKLAASNRVFPSEKLKGKSKA